jgi:hypothetical protein
MPPKIPRIFHFVFGLKPQIEPFHLLYYLCLESCRRINQPEKILFHYHHEPHGAYWDLIRPHLTLVRVELPEFVQRHRYRDRKIARYRYAHAADVVRLQQLLTTGGVYADIDTIFVRPLPPQLFEKSFVLGRERDVVNTHTGQPEPSLCNAFIMAERDAPFGRAWLDRIEAAFDGRWSTHSCSLPYQLSEEHPELVHIEPETSFYKFMWTREGLRALLEERHDLNDAFSLHLWNHLWWEEDRRDFSDVHGRMFTERYILDVDTTINLTARPFLPPPRVLHPD